MIVRVLYRGDDLDREIFSSLFESSFRDLGLSLEFTDPPENLHGRNYAADILSMLLRKTGAHPSILVIDCEIRIPAWARYSDALPGDAPSPQPVVYQEAPG